MTLTTYKRVVHRLLITGEFPRKDTVEYAIDSCKGGGPQWKAGAYKRERDQDAVRSAVPQFEVYAGVRRNIYDCMSKAQLLELLLVHLPVSLETLLRNTSFAASSRESSIRSLNKTTLVELAIVASEQFAKHQEELKANLLEDDENNAQEQQDSDVEIDDEEASQADTHGVDETKAVDTIRGLNTVCLSAQRGLHLVTREEAHKVAKQFFSTSA